MPVLKPVTYEQYALANGLTVILHHIGTSPVAAVMVMYHAGSRNETQGRTGLAHLFEHLMFKGSAHVADGDHFRLLQEVGASVNGSTSEDRTNYYEVVPSNYLELALWLESDRMGFLPEAVDQSKLDNQRDVVKNERRQNYDNVPYGTSHETITRELYGPGHPYSWPVIGSMEDLSAASLEDVKGFFRTYYAPNNACIVVAGDFQRNRVMDWIGKYFSPIPRGSSIAHPALSPAPLMEDKHLVSEESVQLPRLFLNWPGPPRGTRDDALLDVLTTILSSGKNSRLYRPLVFEKKIAQSVSAYTEGKEIAGMVTIDATAKPGTGLGEIERCVRDEIGRLFTDGVTDREIEAAFNGKEVQLAGRLTTALGIATGLAASFTLTGDTENFNREISRFEGITPEEVLDAGRRVFSSHHVALSVVPGGKSSLASPAGTWKSIDAGMTPSHAGAGKTGAGEHRRHAMTVQNTAFQAPDRMKPPSAQPLPRVALPPVQKGKLSSGLPILLVEQHSNPQVVISIVLQSGASRDPRGKSGTAALTAELLDAGTSTRDALEISESVEFIGASLSFRTGGDATFGTLLTLNRHMGEGIALFADVLANPSFPAGEFERLKAQRLTSLVEQKERAASVASNAFMRVIYGEEHPYGKDPAGSEESVGGLTRDDICRFYREHYASASATLIVVGDTTMAGILPVLERELGHWKGVPPHAAPPIPSAPAAPGRVYLIDRPGSPQSEIRIGSPALARTSPDYFPATMMNRVLGGQFSSRINMNLREKRGLTYGARSSFIFLKEPGPFMVGGGFTGSKTGEAAEQLLLEIGAMHRGGITGEELEFSRKGLAGGFALSFETPFQVAGALQSIVLYGLPDDYYERYIENLGSVTAEHVMRVARTTLDPDAMATVVVADAHATRGGLESLGRGEVVMLDAEGAPM